MTNTLNSYVDHPANERKRKLILDQLARHDKAHDALDAALSASAEPMEPVTGMVLVPRVATDAMLRACNNGPGQMVLTNREIWRAMVAASQT